MDGLWKAGMSWQSLHCPTERMNEYAVVAVTSTVYFCCTSVFSAALLCFLSLSARLVSLNFSSLFTVSTDLSLPPPDSQNSHKMQLTRTQSGAGGKEEILLFPPRNLRNQFRLPTSVKNRAITLLIPFSGGSTSPGNQNCFCFLFFSLPLLLWAAPVVVIMRSTTSSLGPKYFARVTLLYFKALLMF